MSTGKKPQDAKTNKKGQSGMIAVFIREYLLCRNATEAAKRAGYSQRTAYSQGARLLKRVDVAAAVERDSQLAIAKTGITQERVLRETELLSFSDVKHYVTDDAGNLAVTPEAPDGATRAISSIRRRVRTGGTTENPWREVDVEIKLWNKPDPLKLAGAYTGTKGFTNRLEVELTNPEEAKAKLAAVLGKTPDELPE